MIYILVLCLFYSFSPFPVLARLFFTPFSLSLSYLSFSPSHRFVSASTRRDRRPLLSRPGVSQHPASLLSPPCRTRRIGHGHPPRRVGHPPTLLSLPLRHCKETRIYRRLGFFVGCLSPARLSLTLAFPASNARIRSSRTRECARTRSRR